MAECELFDLDVSRNIILEQGLTVSRAKIGPIHRALGLRQNGNRQLNEPNFTSEAANKLYAAADEVRDALLGTTSSKPVNFSQLKQWFGEGRLFQDDIEKIINQYGPEIWGNPDASTNDLSLDNPAHLRFIKIQLEYMIYAKAISKINNNNCRSARLEKQRLNFAGDAAGTGSRTQRPKRPSPDTEPLARKRRYVAGGPGGGGRYVDVEDDDDMPAGNHGPEDHTTPDNNPPLLSPDGDAIIRRSNRDRKRPQRLDDGNFRSWGEPGSSDWLADASVLTGDGDGNARRQSMSKSEDSTINHGRAHQRTLVKGSLLRLVGQSTGHPDTAAAIPTRESRYRFPGLLRSPTVDSGLSDPPSSPENEGQDSSHEDDNLRTDLMRRKIRPCPVAEQYNCTVMCASKHSAARHAKTHTATKDFVCPDCANAYASKFNVEEHRRKNRCKKNFFCPICKEGFVKKDGMEEHLRTHQTEEATGDNSGVLPKFREQEELEETLDNSNKDQSRGTPETNHFHAVNHQPPPRPNEVSDEVSDHDGNDEAAMDKGDAEVTGSDDIVNPHQSEQDQFEQNHDNETNDIDDFLDVADHSDISQSRENQGYHESGGSNDNEEHIMEEASAEIEETPNRPSADVLADLGNKRRLVMKHLRGEWTDAEDPTERRLSTDDLWANSSVINDGIVDISLANLASIRSQLSNAEFQRLESALKVFLDLRSYAEDLGRHLSYHPFEGRPRPVFSIHEWYHNMGGREEYRELVRSFAQNVKELNERRARDGLAIEDELRKNVAIALAVAIDKTEFSPQFFEGILKASFRKLLAFELDPLP